MANTKNTIGSATRVFEIVDALSTQKWTGVSELSEQLDLPKSTVYSYLNTLKEDGYVRTENGKYQLSLRFLDLGERCRRCREVFTHARPELDKLAEETGELVNLSVEENSEGVYLYLASGPDAITVDTYPGARVPLYCTALGKVLLAHMDKERREQCIEKCEFEQLTENTTTNPDELNEELQRIRDRGYALDREERSRDLRCVAAPVIVNEECKGVISLTAPVSRMQGERFTSDLPQRILDRANVIQISMTYS